MTGPSFHGKAQQLSDLLMLNALSDGLIAIKRDQGLTYADLGKVLGVSDDQAANYVGGEATMKITTFGRAKRAWGDAFSGPFDKLCAPSYGTAEEADLCAAVSQMLRVSGEVVARHASGRCQSDRAATVRDFRALLPLVAAIAFSNETASRAEDDDRRDAA